MFSVDNFYAYLMHQYSWPRKNNFIWAFTTHGNRNVYDLILRHFNTHDFYEQVRNTYLERYFGSVSMFDQEPVDFKQYFFDYATLDTSSPSGTGASYHKHYSTGELIAQRLSTVINPIICHSERNSDEINFLRNFGFLDVHYWWHGLIARDWFRHWKHYRTNNSSASNRLGCYIRDTTGTRQYRSKLLEFIKDESNIYCPALLNQNYNSDASAFIEWSDTNNFDIHIVAETLFETSKTHLTEKVLKPVAMEQPFILFAGPDSLEYIKNYGFQTFSCCWDESYDTIADSNERYAAIVDLLKFLNKLPADKYMRLINRSKLIAKNNREHFYSQSFEDILISELHTNMDIALAYQEERFFTNPGGLFFEQANKLLPYINDSLPQRMHQAAPKILKHIESQYPEVAKQILKQYPDLF